MIEFWNKNKKELELFGLISLFAALMCDIFDL